MGRSASSSRHWTRLAPDPGRDRGLDDGGRSGHDARMEWMLVVVIASVGYLGWTAVRRARRGSPESGDPAGDTALLAGAWWWSSSGQGHEAGGDWNGGDWNGGASSGGWFDDLAGGEVGGDGGGD